MRARLTSPECVLDFRLKNVQQDGNVILTFHESFCEQVVDSGQLMDRLHCKSRVAVRTFATAAKPRGNTTQLFVFIEF
jgi:hypothetical protein